MPRWSTTPTKIEYETGPVAHHAHDAVATTRLGPMLLVGLATSATLLDCQSAPVELEPRVQRRQASAALAAESQRPNEPAIASAAGLPSHPPAAASTQPVKDDGTACDEYVKRGTPRWLCWSNGAPVDIVASNWDLKAVIHQPELVIPIEALERLPAAPSAAPSAAPPPVPASVCVMTGAYTGTTGFVDPKALQADRCR